MVPRDGLPQVSQFNDLMVCATLNRRTLLLGFAGLHGRTLKIQAGKNGEAHLRLILWAYADYWDQSCPSPSSADPVIRMA
jgi:hypothetical protein